MLVVSLQVIAVHIDNGFMRKDESAKVKVFKFFK
jgi:GMP synthase PP-ATPase subunit